MEDTGLQLLILVIAMTAAGFTQSSMGFGFAITSLSLMPYFFDIRMANVVISLTALVPLSYTLLRHRQHIPARPVRQCLLGAVAGLPLGLATFAYVNPDLLVRGTGLVILLVVVDGCIRSNRAAASDNESHTWSFLAGMASGYLSGSVAIGGPPVVAFATRQSWGPAPFKAFLGAFLLTVAAVKACSLAAMGYVDSHILMLSLVAIPCCYSGAWLGHFLTQRMNARLFRYLTLSLLAIGAAGMLIRGKPNTHTNKQAEPPGEVVVSRL